MAELSVNCPQCGQEITAASDLEVAKLAKEHMKTAHDTDVPLEQAHQMVKDMLEGQSGE
jgi:predicted small metal-binding protein